MTVFRFHLSELKTLLAVSFIIIATSCGGPRGALGYLYSDCSTLTDQTSCEGITGRGGAACLWGAANGQSACVPNYSTCVELNNDPALTGAANQSLLESICTANVNNTGSSGYSCVWNPTTSSCGGDCLAPMANCAGIRASGGVCGQEGSIERFVCVARPADGSCGVDDAQLATTQNNCKGGSASKSACTALNVATGINATCFWGGIVGGGGNRRY